MSSYRDARTHLKTLDCPLTVSFLNVHAKGPWEYLSSKLHQLYDNFWVEIVMQKEKLIFTIFPWTRERQNANKAYFIICVNQLLQRFLAVESVKIIIPDKEWLCHNEQVLCFLFNVLLSEYNLNLMQVYCYFFLIQSVFVGIYESWNNIALNKRRPEFSNF